MDYRGWEDMEPPPPIRPCPDCLVRCVDPESPYGSCTDCWADHDAEVR